MILLILRDHGKHAERALPLIVKGTLLARPGKRLFSISFSARNLEPYDE